MPRLDSSRDGSHAPGDLFERVPQNAAAADAARSEAENGAHEVAGATSQEWRGRSTHSEAPPLSGAIEDDVAAARLAASFRRPATLYHPSLRVNFCGGGD